jgi:hypothetical protein
MVARRCQEDKSLGAWVSAQRKHHDNDKLRLDPKTTLDALEVV